MAFQRALKLMQQGLDLQAETLLHDILQRDPQHFDSLHLLGLIHLRRKDWASGLALLERAVAVNDGFAPLHNNCGIALRELKRFDEAIASYDRALRLQPDHADALNNRGNVLRDLKWHAEALACYDQSLALKPINPPALNNRGHVLRELGRVDEALSSHERALVLKPDYVEALKARGRALEALQRLEEARAGHALAVTLAPDDVEALSDLGSVLDDLHRPDEALACFDRALALEPEAVALLSNRATVLGQLGRHDEAARAFARALELQPDHPYGWGSLLFSRMNVCDWAGRAASMQQLERAIDEGRKAALPFTTVALCSDAARQLRCARAFAADQHPLDVLPGDFALRGHGHDRIQLAYVSADFHDHATAHLMIDLFESHDRERFEIWAVSLGPDRPSEMRQRLKRAFEHFIDARTMNDRQVALTMRDLEIDIAIDLKGYTRDSRPGIFAHRAAPLQVSYLGYPGTMGHEAIDYLIADATVIPESDESAYSEKVLRLPDSYQINARSRAVAERTPSRAECGLPDTGFVFSCFNNNYKITPEVFDIWMRVLQAVDGSVLWLLEDNPAASGNLRREALARGVAPDRLVFALRVALPEHLARHRQADLFLDTLPCNAHTTASDALWAGLPLLTCAGSTFAGRVAASLLQAVGLPELITHSLAAYEAAALQWATEPARLHELRSRLDAQRLAQPLFDPVRFRRHLESAFVTMRDRHLRGWAPVAFNVAPMDEQGVSTA
ncbi:MAG: tetratricopeptide repeat protein [Pseudomonadota bacterium]|nr:tetratricopeptide repeat protein [Pseudomonadota bacterium]